MSRPQAYLILILCYAGGGLGVYAGMQAYLRALDSTQWPSVEGIISFMEVDGRYSDTASDRTWGWYADMQYTYSVEGRKYQNDRLKFRPDNRRSKEYSTQVAEQYPEGKTVQVYYSPRDPQRSILQTGASTTMLIPAVIGLLIMGIPTLCVVLAMGQEMLPPNLRYWLKIKFGRA